MEYRPMMWACSGASPDGQSEETAAAAMFAGAV